MDIVGKIKSVLPERSGTSERGEWKVATYVIETMEPYPKQFAFEVSGVDRINRFGIKEGDVVKVWFDISGREWEGKWFNTIRAYDVRQWGAGQTSSMSAEEAVDKI